MIKRILLIIGLILAPHAARADVLTWEKCLDLAYDGNPDLRSAREAFAAGESSYNGSFNAVMPSVTLTNSYNRSNNDVREERWQASANAHMDIINLTDVADIRLASAELARADASLANISTNVLFNLRQAFAGLLYAQQQVVVDQNILTIRERNARLVTLRYNSGRESKGNMMRAKAEFLQSQRDLTQAGRAVRTAQQGMSQQLGFDSFEAIVTTGTLSIAPPQSAVPSDIGELAENHPSVAVEKANVAAAAAASSRAHSSLWPVLSANYSRGVRGATEFPNDNDSWSASGVLSYAAFGGGPTSLYYDVKTARLQQKAAEQNLRSARNAARTDLENAYADLAAASEDIEVQGAFLDASRQRNAEADISYSNGLMSYEDWEKIVSERVGFEQSLIRAQRDAVIAEAAWDKASGKVLIK
jgi:outer membrane protein TolC